jgi:hypothetical protein
MNVQRPRIRFTPARLKARHDGWTPERQVRFIEALAQTRSVTRACRAVGMTSASAYKLRGHAEAAEFALAWRRALADRPVERNGSRRTLARRGRVGRTGKVSEVQEMHDATVSAPPAGQSAVNLQTFRTLMAQLRGPGQ